MPRSVWSRPRSLDEFDHLVESRGVGTSFQPIVELSSGDVVAYEALARTDAASSFRDASALFAEAYRRGRVGELDWVCRAAVFRAVLDSKVPPELAVFVNVEPAALGAPCPVDIVGLYAEATRQCRFVVEVTERSLADDPAQLIAAVNLTRDMSIGVALDDVGAHPASLALMPIVAPDVIKLDLSVIQSQSNPEIARVVSAVFSEAERTGAVVVAEGVESPRHLATAESMGATLGQGWLFGAPGPLPPRLESPARGLMPFSAPAEIAETPFAAVSRHRTPTPSTRRHLAATSHHLERQVLESAGKAVLLSSFQHSANFTPAIRARYEELAPNTVLTAAMGAGMKPIPGAGIRGVNLREDDPLCREWTVIVLGSHVSAALIAHEVNDPADPGRFSAIVTHDRNLVVAAARSLCRRLPSLAPARYLRY